MKVELVYWIEGYNTLEYNMSEEDIEDYIEWCESEDLKVNDKQSLIEYLETYMDFDEDMDIKNSILEKIDGSKLIMDECTKLINGNKRNKEKIY